MTTSQKHHQKHSPVALDGACTRDGGVVMIPEGITRPTVDGYRVAVVGDAVHYVDGQLAYIQTGSLAPATYHNQPLAMIGSIIDNGDVIISTPSERLEVV